MALVLLPAMAAYAQPNTFTPANANRAPMPTSCGQPPATASQISDGAISPTATCATVRYVRVNVHFVQNASGGQNFEATNKLNTPNLDDNGYRWAQVLTWNANWTNTTPSKGWAGNVQMNLPYLNTTPVLSKRIELVLNKVCFDRVPGNMDAQRTYSTANQFDTLPL